MAIYLLQQDGSYLLLESSGKIILQEGSSSSLSSSLSPSHSPSPTPSLSFSLSPSLSISASESPSPSYGTSIYTKTSIDNLPLNDDDLDTPYTEQEEMRIVKRDKTYVSQTGILEYMVHQYKIMVGNYTKCAVEWEGRSTLAPSESPVYLQIYNQITASWETIDTESSASQDVNFELSKKITNLANYATNKLISCRIYQLALE